MTPRERLLTVLKGGIPDCVPVMPDISDMIPTRRTSKPTWEVHLYKNPPIWEAQVDTYKYFDADYLMDGGWPLLFGDLTGPFSGGIFSTPWDLENGSRHEWEEFIVFKSEEKLITQASYVENGKRTWAPTVEVYYRDNPSWEGIFPEKINLPPVPKRWEPIEGIRQVDTSPESFKHAKALIGDQGLIGTYLATSCVFYNMEDIYKYYDNPDKHDKWAADRIEQVERRFKNVMSMDVKPDFFCVGGSGTLVFQSMDMFRRFTFPAVKRAIELATEAGFPTHFHSCGPEKELVKLLAEETSLTVIDPLEIPPMGDCELAELKALYGDKIVLKGNLHTTDVMLTGSVQDVIDAGKKAIDDAAAGGRFILSTGDQCGRDTPDENIRAMIETARTYGKY